MKRQLLTTTALVAAGVIAVAGAANAQKASKPTLTIGGWVEGIFGGADQDEEVVGNRVGWDSQYDSEFLFRGRVTLDNGIRIRTQAELEGETSGDQWDEAWMAISGSFGEIRVGSEDAAAHLMVTGYSGSWATAVGQNLNLDTGDWLARPSGVGNVTGVRLDLGESDANLISYFTPRIAGFQLGATYIPSFEECAASGTGVTGCSSSIASTSGSAHNGFSVAANFDRKFDQVRVGIGVGYSMAQQPDRAAGTPAEPDPSDPKGYVVGGSVEFAGFKVAAGYKRILNSSTGVTRNSQEVLDLGARYSFGKNAISVGYITGESEGSGIVDGDDENHVAMIAYRRTLGPGVQYRLNFFWADFEGETAGSTDDNDGYAVTTSVRVAF
jgi:predicted porin